MKRFLKWAALAVLILTAVGAGSFGFMLYKDTHYIHSEPYERSGGGKADVLVVYYSRSGNTEGAARAVARFFDADLLRIESPRYTLDYQGWRDSADDAADKVTTTDISYPPVDPSQYDIVALGSPIWLFRPAPPLWTFVEENRFDGASVLLFNTFNSRFVDEEIATFQALVEQQGGAWLDHVYVRRGRIISQKAPQEVHDELGEQLRQRVERFDGVRRQ